MENFLEYVEKRQIYHKVLSDLSEYIEKHSDILKYHKLNNFKGLKVLLKGLYKYCDKFIEEGSDIELVLKDGEIL